MANDKVLGFIGAGSMSHALIGGLTVNGYDPALIWVSNPTKSKLAKLQEQYGVNTHVNNQEVARKADVIVLTVKPMIISIVASEIASIVQAQRPLVTSVAAGVRIASLEKWLGGEAAVVRCMPNTAAMIGASATGLYANQWVDDDQKALAESLLRAVGVVQWLEDESLLDVVTALSGSGPAYFYLMMEALETAAVEMGLSTDTAHLLTVQTALGAARMALETKQELATLREFVTSPGGTTERALRSLNDADISAILARAMEVAKARAVQLSDELDQG